MPNGECIRGERIEGHMDTLRRDVDENTKRLNAMGTETRDKFDAIRRQIWILGTIIVLSIFSATDKIDMLVKLLGG